MAYKCLHNDIIFIEGSEKFIKSFGKIEYRKDRYYNNQLQNIDNVKEQMSNKAKQLGANAIINFKYGQRNTTWLRSMLLAFDDNVNWFGSGEAVQLNEDLYKRFIEECKEK